MNYCELEINTIPLHAQPLAMHKDKEMNSVKTLNENAP